MTIKNMYRVTHESDPSGPFCYVIAKDANDVYNAVGVVEYFIDPSNDQNALVLKANHVPGYEMVGYDAASIGGSGIVKQPAIFWCSLFDSVPQSVLLCQSEW